MAMGASPESRRIRENASLCYRIEETPGAFKIPAIEVAVAFGTGTDHLQILVVIAAAGGDQEHLLDVHAGQNSAPLAARAIETRTTALAQRSDRRIAARTRLASAAVGGKLDREQSRLAARRAVVT